jgi:hypothetical protein
VKGLPLAGAPLAVTGDMQRKEQLILKQVFQSIAVAVTIVFLGHFLIWLVAQGVRMPDGLSDPPAYVGDQTKTPPDD